MDKKVIQKSKLRLLVNAEAFGFGPTVAIASFFPHLTKYFEYISYIGKNHTLDLQSILPYKAIHDISNFNKHAEKKKFQNIAKNYDIFLTAMDFETAEWAKEAGLKVCIYDALTWYWKNIPPIVKKSDLYIAQNFFGVKQKIQKDKSLFPPFYVIPSIVSS